MTDAMGIKMYGPTRWAAMKNTGAPALGWNWSDVGSGILNVGKSAVGIFSTAQQAKAYKDIATQATTERQDLINNLIKFGAIAGIGIVALNLLKKA